MRMNKAVLNLSRTLGLRCAMTALVGLVLASCSSPTEPIPCATRWAEVSWSELGLPDVEITALQETPWGLFAATDTSGVFVLDPGTGEWEGRGLEGRRVTSLGFAGPPHRVLAGVFVPGGEGWSPPDTFVVASEDGGRTWRPSDAGFPAHDGGEWPHYRVLMRVDETDRRAVYAAGREGILRSLDAGQSWEFLRETNAPTALGFTSAEGGVVFVGVYSSGIHIPLLLRGANRGLDWEAVQPYPGTSLAPSAFAVDPSTPSRVWMGAPGPGGDPGVVVRSEDAGVTWGSEWSTGPGLPIGLAADGDAVVAVVTDGREGTFQALVSCDLGDSFQAVPPPAGGNAEATAMTTASDGSLLIGTVGRGVWRLEAVGK